MTRSDELEVRRLMERYLSQSMSERDAERWLKYVEMQPELNDELLDHLALDDMLRDLSRGGQVDSSLAQAVVEVIEHRSWPWVRRHPLWTFAACLLLFVAVAALVGLLVSRQHLTAPAPTIQREIVFQEVFQEREKAILCARLEATVDPLWTDFIPGDELNAGSYEIRSGLLRLRFVSGATALIVGPARFELLSPDRIACSQGRLDVVVPPEAVGFRVDLPETSVIDLGTVFSIVVAEKRSEIQVHRGRVALTEPLIDRSILDAGQAIRLHDGFPARFCHADLSRRKSIEQLAEVAPEHLAEQHVELEAERDESRKILLPDCFLIAQRVSGKGESENTISAFRSALEIGVDACELDVTAAGDGTLFVIHPGATSSISLGGKAFSELSRKEIKRFSAGNKKAQAEGERIATLDETLEFFRNESIAPIVVDVFETKSAPAVIEALDRSGLSDRVILTGRTLESAGALKRLRPLLCVGLCIDAMKYSSKDPNVAQEISDAASSVGADFVKVEYPLASEDLIARLRENGLPVWVYTVNTPEEMNYCRRIGAVGVLTGRADLLVGAGQSEAKTAPPVRPVQQGVSETTD